MRHIFFIHSSVNGHLGSLHSLAIADSAALNIECLKVRVSDVGYKPITPQGEAPGFAFPLYYGSPRRGGVDGGVVSLPFLAIRCDFSLDYLM